MISRNRRRSPNRNRGATRSITHLRNSCGPAKRRTFCDTTAATQSETLSEASGTFGNFRPDSGGTCFSSDPSRFRSASEDSVPLRKILFPRLDSERPGRAPSMIRIASESPAIPTTPSLPCGTMRNKRRKLLRFRSIANRGVLRIATDVQPAPLLICEIVAIRKPTDILRHNRRNSIRYALGSFRKLRKLPAGFQRNVLKMGSEPLPARFRGFRAPSEDPFPWPHSERPGRAVVNDPDCVRKPVAVSVPPTRPAASSNQRLRISHNSHNSVISPLPRPRNAHNGPRAGRGTYVISHNSHNSVISPPPRRGRKYRPAQNGRKGEKFGF